MPVPATALYHESTIVAVVELSARSWLVGARRWRACRGNVRAGSGNSDRGIVLLWHEGS